MAIEHNERGRRWASSLIRHGVIALGGAGLGLLAFGLLLLSDLDSYLLLQENSDPLHRWAVIGLPSALVVLIIMWSMSELGRLGNWLRWTGRVLAGLALAYLTGMPVFVVCYDMRLESSGLQGQWTRHQKTASPPGALGPEGLFRERSAAQPNLSVEGFSEGGLLTLDRRTLALRRNDDTFAWSQPRPGPAPAALRLKDGRIIYSGSGRTFEDDVVLAAFDQASGKPIWSLNCLGNSISPPVLDGQALAFTTWRPATSTVQLLDLRGARHLWARRFAGSIRLAPRFVRSGIQVAIDGDLMILSPEDGRVVQRQRACPASNEVVCGEGQVVAWSRGEMK